MAFDMDKTIEEMKKNGLAKNPMDVLLDRAEKEIGTKIDKNDFMDALDYMSSKDIPVGVAQKTFTRQLIKSFTGIYEKKTAYYNQVIEMLFNEIPPKYLTESLLKAATLVNTTAAIKDMKPIYKLNACLLTCIADLEYEQKVIDAIIDTRIYRRVKEIFDKSSSPNETALKIGKMLSFDKNNVDKMEHKEINATLFVISQTYFCLIHECKERKLDINTYHINVIVKNFINEEEKCLESEMKFYRSSIMGNRMEKILEEKLYLLYLCACKYGILELDPDDMELEEILNFDKEKEEHILTIIRNSSKSYDYYYIPGTLSLMLFERESVTPRYSYLEEHRKGCRLDFIKKAIQCRTQYLFTQMVEINEKQLIKLNNMPEDLAEGMILKEAINWFLEEVDYTAEIELILNLAMNAELLASYQEDAKEAFIKEALESEEKKGKNIVYRKVNVTSTDEYKALLAENVRLGNLLDEEKAKLRQAEKSATKHSHDLEEELRKLKKDLKHKEDEILHEKNKYSALEELFDLSQETEDVEVIENTESILEAHKYDKLLIVGGNAGGLHHGFSDLKNRFPNAVFLDALNKNIRQTSDVTGIVFVTTQLVHAHYYKVRSTYDGTNTPYIYLNSKSYNTALNQLAKGLTAYEERTTI